MVETNCVVCGSEILRGMKKSNKTRRRKTDTTCSSHCFRIYDRLYGKAYSKGYQRGYKKGLKNG